MSTYYNENDPFAAEWLRELIKAGHIAPGDVDDRSIVDVTPVDLKPYDQCHFFAGIGVWSYALRQARWPDNKPVWTGSCPCQPFSAAGKRAGAGDDRDLWWAFFWLIQQCRPETVFGEQVSSKDGLTWWDTVQTDLERAGYAAATFDLCAAGVGAPHIRQRLYWVANSETWGRWEEQSNPSRLSERINTTQYETGGFSTSGAISGMANSGQSGLEKFGVQPAWTERQAVERGGEASGLEHASSVGRKWGQAPAPGHDDDGSAPGGAEGQHGLGLAGPYRLHQDGARPLHGHWRAADWLYCRDDRWRPVEPGTFPLAHGATARVGRLRGYGNAIVAPLAQAFIEAYQEVTA